MGLFWWRFLLLGAAALLLGDCTENDGDPRPSGNSNPTSRRSCPSDKFKCNSGRCVVKEYVCDNVDDCGDMSDERHVNCTKLGNYWIKKDTTCSRGEFRCDNGRCIPEKYVCDNVPDCKDGSDETYVNCTEQEKHCRAFKNSFKCRDGNCIPERWTCDGIRKQSCADGSDEAGCLDFCPAHQFKCTSGPCIPKHLTCDGYDHCGDQSDEVFCGRPCSRYEFRCDNGRCVPDRNTCDGFDDCKDNSDEDGCIHRPCRDTGYFQCSNGVCIPLEKTCSLYDSCGDYSDETHTKCNFHGIPHSLSYFRTVVSEPSDELPRFTAVAYLDGLFFEHYTSHINKVQFVPPSLDVDMQLFGSQLTILARLQELRFRTSLLSLQNHHNQTEGLHTWQCLEVCEFSEDGSASLYHRDAYDGREQDSPHHLTKSLHRKGFVLSFGCIAWLQIMMTRGKEHLVTAVSPEVKVVHKVSYVYCHVYGFYPKKINATWLKDGEDQEEQILRGDVLPNSDGTHYTWIAIKINPKFGGHYKCIVEHAGLTEPLVMEESGLAMALKPIWKGLLGGILGTVACVLLVGGILFYARNNRGSNISRIRVSNEAYNEGKFEEEFCLSANPL